MKTKTKRRAARSSANGKAAPLARTFLAVPHYGAVEPDGLPGLMLASDGAAAVTVRLNPCSLLAHNFNRLFCDMLNERAERGYTHFAMMHADQSAPPGWLDVLLAEMDRVGADVLSTALAIKDSRGLTSTGERDPAGGSIRRYTLTELHRMPETFCAADVCPGKELMVNTGLWVARLGPWAESFPGFNIEDRIVRCADGKFRAGVFPEDWKFSSWCHEQGLRVFATRKVSVVHYGRWGFRNDEPFGSWKTDEGDSY